MGCEGEEEQVLPTLGMAGFNAPNIEGRKMSVILVMSKYCSNK
jgi:hypothetical protein